MPDVRPALPVEHAQLYELLVSELQDFIVVLLDAEGRFASWNPGVGNHFGYSEGEFVGQPSSLIYTPEDREVGVDQQELETARAHRRAADIRWHRRKDGSLMFGDGVMVALRDDAGRLLGFSKVIRDVTERQIEQERLRDLTTALKQAQILILSTDRTIQFWSDGARRLYGFSSEEAIGRNADELLQTTLPEPLDDLLRVLDEKEHWHGELRHVHRDGSLVVVSSDWVLRRDAQGRPCTIVEANTDITALKQAEQVLLRANEDLQHFAFAASHDLQEPLRMIRTFSDLLARRHKGKLEVEADEFIGRIREGAERMDRLICDLLAWLRVADGQEPPPQQADCNQIIEATLSTLQPAISEATAVITCDELPVVPANPSSVAQVFQNLISNAIKYRSGQPPRVHISARAEGPDWVFSVQDNGVGFEPSESDKVFQVFRRLHGRNIPGTGIGLALCKRIVERHGGRIWVESEAGLGSTFYFSLPRG